MSDDGWQPIETAPPGSGMDLSVAKNYKSFSHAIIKEALNGGNWDGGDIQALAVKMGLVRETKFDPLIHGDSDIVEKGDTWYVLEDGKYDHGRLDFTSCFPSREQHDRRYHTRADK